MQCNDLSVQKGVYIRDFCLGGALHLCIMGGSLKELYKNRALNMVCKSPSQNRDEKNNGEMSAT